MRNKFFIFFLIVIFIIFIYLLISYQNNEQNADFYKENWGYKYLDIDGVKDKYSLDGSGVKVALIDTGVSNFINVVEGINIFDGSNNINDDHGHGTHIASILSSKDLGVASGIDLYVVKGLDKDMKGEMDNIIKSLLWVEKRDVDIILMPFGTLRDSPEMEKLVKRLIGKGIIIISSVGNLGMQDNSEVMYPARYENVIGVGALNREGNVWRGTTVNKGLDVLLPGQYINGYSVDGDNFISSGTSMASAYMTGLMALLIEKDSLDNNGTSNLNLDYLKKNGIINESYHLNTEKMFK